MYVLPPSDLCRPDAQPLLDCLESLAIFGDQGIEKFVWKVERSKGVHFLTDWFSQDHRSILHFLLIRKNPESLPALLPLDLVKMIFHILVGTSREMYWLWRPNLKDRLPSYVEGYLNFLRDDDSKYSESLHPLIDSFQMPHLLKLIDDMRRSDFSGRVEGNAWRLDLNHVIDDAIRGFSYGDVPPEASHLLSPPFPPKVLYVVLAVDRSMRVGFVSHSVLAQGRPVLAAGELLFGSNGNLDEINNGSGHYRCSVDSLELVRELVSKDFPRVKISKSLRMRNEAGVS